MRFLFTPEEAQTTASRVGDWLSQQQFAISVETAVSADAPYRTTLIGTKSGFSWFVEAQGTPNYAGQIERFASWLSARRLHSELYLAVPESASIPGRLLRELKRDGVGLMLVTEDGGIEIHLKARNPALVVTPDPTLALGSLRQEVLTLLERFNAGDRKDALRDMCEAVERETQKLLTRLRKSGWITLSDNQIAKMTWSDQINALASPNQYQGGRSPLLSASERDDLHSFRGARNLIDHKAASKREESRREQQFTERMMQGPRLAALLIALGRKVR